MGSNENDKFDFEKETQRWLNFIKATQEEEQIPSTTPRIPVWKKNKATLWYYEAPEKKFETPVFLIYSLINQPFILDLAPGNSLIESFTQYGFDVYLIDFGIPGYEDKELTIGHYIFDYIQKAVQKALIHSKAHEMTIMGFCLGGTFAAMYAAIAKEPIKNLILSASPVDFTFDLGFDAWAAALRDGKVDLDPFIDAIGILPASMVEAGIRLITSPIYFSPYLSLLNRADDENYVKRWRLFNMWTKGHIPLSGATLKQLLQELGKENNLVKGRLSLKDKSVDLANIKSNLLVIATDSDRLVPHEQTYAIMDLVSSKDKKFLLLTGGHTAVPNHNGLPHYLKEWLPVRSKPL